MRLLVKFSSYGWTRLNRIFLKTSTKVGPTVFLVMYSLNSEWILLSQNPNNCCLELLRESGLSLMFCINFLKYSVIFSWPVHAQYKVTCLKPKCECCVYFLYSYRICSLCSMIILKYRLNLTMWSFSVTQWFQAKPSPRRCLPYLVDVLISTVD